jgi:hypothetical protein
MISWDSEKFMSEEEFFDCCESTITGKDFQILKNARIVPASGEEIPANPVLDKWNSWERSLRNELVKMRAGKKGQDGEKYLSSGNFETGVLETAREAFNSASPLEAEVILDRARWDYLDMLEAGHYFDLGRLIIYFLQLQILYRKGQINREKGKSGFEELYRNITEKAGSQNNSQ